MYNWYSNPCTNGAANCSQNPALQFIPTLWSNASALTSVWPSNVELALSRGTKSLFSFNEPDVCYPGSACMDIPSAVSTYKSSMMPYRGRALLGAPAVTNAGAPYGLSWLSNFMGNCTGCHFDFVNVHWYSNVYAGANYFESFINQTRQVAAGRPIVVTEFALDGTNAFTEAQNEAFLTTVMDWMDRQSDIMGYAYFMDAAGLLMDGAGRDRTALGDVYQNEWGGVIKGGMPA